MRNVLFLSTLAVCGLAAGGAQAGQYQFLNLDDGGPVQTQLNGISTNGIVVGSVRNGRGGLQGLIWAAGNFTRVKEGGGTEFFAVNQRGRAVGHADGFGFEYDLNTGATKFTGPEDTELVAVNDSGVAVGFKYRLARKGVFVDASGSVTLIQPAGHRDAPLSAIGNGGRAVGVAYEKNGHPPTLYSVSDRIRKVPGSAALGVPVQVTSDGAIIGNATVGTTGEEGYRLLNGQVETVTYPGAVVTHVVGVDRLGRFYGTYAPSSSGPVTGSFVFDGTSYLPLAFPGATNTDIRAVNDSGQIVGGYTMAGATHAFLGTCTLTQQPCTQ